MVLRSGLLLPYIEISGMKDSIILLNDCSSFSEYDSARVDDTSTPNLNTKPLTKEILQGLRGNSFASVIYADIISYL